MLDIKISEQTEGFIGYQFKTKLRFARIFFDTSTFDEIVKDERAKFVDKELIKYFAVWAKVFSGSHQYW